MGCSVSFDGCVHHCATFRGRGLTREDTLAILGDARRTPAFLVALTAASLMDEAQEGVREDTTSTSPFTTFPRHSNDIP